MSNKLNRDSFWVVIPTYNRIDDLIATLDSLTKSEVNMNQVIVIDNGSKDDTVVKMQSCYPNVHLLALETNIGATGGSNTGFDYALKQGADYVIRMDSDIEVDPGFLAPLIEMANSDSNIGIISPKIYFFDPPDRIWYGGVESKGRFFKISDGFRGQGDSPENSSIRKVDYVWGATMLINCEVLKKTGGFDTDFFVYYEEFDFCDRTQTLGYKIIYVPESKIWHKVGSISYNAFTAYNWNKSKMIFIRKHAPNIIGKLYYILYAFAFAFFYAFVDIITHALKLRKRVGNRGPFKDAIHGLWNGLILPLTDPLEKK